MEALIVLGVAVLRRGVTLTPAGATLLDEARTLLERVERARVAAVAGAGTLTVGMLSDRADPGAHRPAAALTAAAALVGRRGHAEGVGPRTREQPAAAGELWPASDRDAGEWRS
ncbi:hypothetical protein [Streptomyces sp. NPDC096033]|uniref:hypothetical protein n=1 Tax=Streptomyces sp. NPDC096033 TaxID=3366071 RepID=UPI0038025175